MTVNPMKPRIEESKACLMTENPVKLRIEVIKSLFDDRKPSETGNRGNQKPV